MSDLLKQIANLSPKQLALLAMRTQSKLDAIEQERTEPIAIIGMACRFPGGAQDPESFWRLLRDGVDTITEMPAERWGVNTYSSPSVKSEGREAALWGSFLNDVDQFDAAFFGISPREANSMDPQQRLLLEVAWEAFEHAGQTTEQLNGASVGTFIGISGSDYLHLRPSFSDEIDANAYAVTGNASSVAAGRLAYVLGLQGPVMAVDTACSSSLVAVHLACQSLRAQECNMALAGGVHLILFPEVTENLSTAHMLAPDGRCKAFDARADGFVRGEGCGLIVLKRLTDALNDGDPILALIRGSAVNHDGHSSGLTVPNGPAQQVVIRQALANGNVNPSQVDYLEAHGTGTSLGDPIEFGALTAVFSAGRTQENPLLLGSVKTNVGHLEAAAGIAGLIKVILALQHEEIPPHIHFQTINPRINLASLPAVIPTERLPWTRGSKRRIAGVSSFGISGTNAHVVLEEAPALPVSPSAAPSEPATSAPQPALLPLSARTQPALLALAQRYLPLLDSLPAELFPSLCSSASQRRSHLPARLALLASSPSQAAERLRSFLDHPDLPADPPGLAPGLLPPGGRPRLVWVFPGQGWQFPGMVRPLLSRFPAFQQAFSSCQQALLAAGIPPLDELLAQPERWLQLDVLQPLLFAIQVSLASLWLSWGLLPDALIGHSLGEVAAAHLAGVLSLEQAATIVAERSRLLEQLRGQGAMLSVELSEQEAELLLAQQGWQTDLAVAVSNGPHSSVLAGSRSALDAVERFLQARQVNARWVEVPVASHCGQVEPILPALRSRLAGLRGHQGHLAWYSTVSGLRQEGEGLTGEYWVRNLRERVRLWAAVQAVLSEGPASFVEISAHPVLVGSLAQGLAEVDKASLALWSLRRERAEEECLLESLAQLYVRGHEPAWDRLLPAPPRWVDLPTYPWQHERYWITNQRVPRGKSRKHLLAQPGKAQHHPFLGDAQTLATQADVHFWDTEIDTEMFPYLADHQIAGQIVLPATAYMELALAASAHALPPSSPASFPPCSLHDLLLHDALLLPPPDSSSSLSLQVLLSSTSRLQIFSRPNSSSAPWRLHASARLAPPSLPDSSAPSVSLDELRALCPHPLSVTTFYQRLRTQGLAYGPSFQAISHLWTGSLQALASLHLPQTLSDSDLSSYWAHPALLDACLQVLAAALPDPDPDPDSDPCLYLPLSLEHLLLLAPLRPPFYRHARLRPSSPHSSHLL